MNANNRLEHIHGNTRLYGEAAAEFLGIAWSTLRSYLVRSKTFPKGRVDATGRLSWTAGELREWKRTRNQGRRTDLA